MSHQTLLNIPPKDLPKDCTHGEQNEPGSCGSMPGSAAQSGSTCVPARPHRSPRISYRCHTGEGMKAPSSTTQINIEVLFQLDQTSWSISSLVKSNGPGPQGPYFPERKLVQLQRRQSQQRCAWRQEKLEAAEQE